MKDPEVGAMNQSRVGVEGKSGTTMPGAIFQRTTFRKYFVGGLAALGLAWFLTSVKPFSSKLEPVSSKVEDFSRGGSKPPTLTRDKDTTEYTEGPTLKTGPKVASPHGGAAAAQSEGSKPRP